MTAPRVLIVEARFYDDIADHLLRGASAALGARRTHVERIAVPGIFELPTALAFAVAAAERSPGTHGYDGYVVLGCAIRGETDHYDHICREAMGGVRELAVRHLLALGNGILTVHDRDQALARCAPGRGDFGGQAGRACLRMIDLRAELGQNPE